MVGSNQLTKGKDKMSAASQILPSVNAPYSQNLCARQLAESISSVEAATKAMGPVFSFFTEIEPNLQKAFISEMGLSFEEVRLVADHLQASCPFPLRFYE